MGLINAVFGTDSTEPTATEIQRKYAVLLNAGPDDTPTAGNAFNYVLELDDAGFEAQLYLDGEAAQWPAEFAENPDRPYNRDWERIVQNGLLAGVCGACANAFDVVDDVENAGLNLMGDGSDHEPSLPELAEDNYEILTV